MLRLPSRSARSLRQRESDSSLFADFEDRRHGLAKYVTMPRHRLRMEFRLGTLFEIEAAMALAAHQGRGISPRSHVTDGSRNIAHGETNSAAVRLVSIRPVQNERVVKGCLTGCKLRVQRFCVINGFHYAFPSP